ncbi:unnamed protein product [Amaranthus hypochondriacus]
MAFKFPFLSPNFKPIIILIISLMLLISTVDSSIGGYDLDQWMVSSDSSMVSCQDDGIIGECLEDEFQFDSESNRRMLASRRYISYGALRRNYVPCSRRGASYYNCRPGASANPYRRGCSRIARCRRS